MRPIFASLFVISSTVGSAVDRTVVIDRIIDHQCLSGPDIASSAIHFAPCNQSTVQSWRLKYASTRARPLARMIQVLKTTGIYDRTLIAVYTTDGGRGPAADSYGYEGKNTVMMAGGMIRGGYFGDISASPMTDGNAYFYHRPDRVSGAPVPVGRSDNSGRVPGAEVWQTVMKALRVPPALTGGYTDATSGHMEFILQPS